MNSITRVLFACLLFLIACKNGTTDNRLHPGVEKTTSDNTSTRFELLAPDRTGINFTPVISDEHRYNFIADPYIYNGGGVAILDVNNDGLQDIFFTNRLQGCRLYLNKGGLKFEDLSDKAGISKFSGLKTGATVVDINADGWQDIYVCRTWLEPVPDRRNLLFINNKDNTFSEQAAAYHLDDLSASQDANFFDFDGDGDLDCYVVNHPVDFKTMNNLDYNAGNARQQPPRGEWESDRLFKNNGGVFEDVTQKAGMLNRAFGLSSVAADFNADGKTDLFVGNDFVMPDFLYINQGNGRFVDEADRYFRHTSNHTMGADLADINNDGFSDLITLDMLAQPITRRNRLMNTMQRARDKQMQAQGYGRQVMRNVLQLNNENQGFSDIACMTGVYATDWSWAPLLADFDNDGWRDLFISNGIQRDLNDLDFFVFTADSINRSGGVNKNRFPDFNEFVKLMPSEPVGNYVFHNKGNLQFEDVSESWGFGKKGFSNGAAYADLDNDGDLDLITNNLQAPPAVYENKAIGSNANHWLQVKCQGTEKNPFGIGATVRVYAKQTTGAATPTELFAQEMTNVRGFYSSSEAIFQVGLGEITQIDQIEIDWAENKHEILTNIPANQRLVLKISNAKPGKCPAHKNDRPAYVVKAADNMGVDFVHSENDFEDFDREKLLPSRISRTGPCLSTGDLNKDGLEDLFFGGASGQSGAVYFQQPNGKFIKSSQPALEKDKQCEDTASAFFDADSDGDLDLWVVSGGNEAAAGSAIYQDRLYLNDGSGNFSTGKNLTPTETVSGSCVAVLDFNGDGKLDVIVGGRCVPGRFPEPGETLVCLNEGGKFRNVAAEIAPELQKIGMVTDVKTADLNGDGVQEIIVCGEWMAVSIFQWNGQKFENKTAAFGLQNATGLWQCLTVADLDGDGDQDLLAGNMGTNSRFHASTAAPLRLFANDFDGNKSHDPIIALAENGAYYPALQREALAAQLPMVRKKFPRNAPYAQATISEIFSENELFKELFFDAQTLESQWFENNNGHFSAHPLPYFAQISSVQKILALDANADGVTDIITLGNNYGMDIETYQLDASAGYLFIGQGKGAFVPEPEKVGALREVRSAAVVTEKTGQKLLVIGNNNAACQVFSLTSSKN